MLRDVCIKVDRPMIGSRPPRKRPVHRRRSGPGSTASSPAARLDADGTQRPRSTATARLATARGHAAAAAPAEAEEDFPWHDPALPMDERLKLAEGKPYRAAS